MTTIGVLGASGTVGRVAVDRLASWDLGDLRLGGRDLDRAAEVGAQVPAARTEPVRVDLNDADALRAFCAGCDVVVNCAGPSYLVLDTVARRRWRAGLTMSTRRVTRPPPTRSAKAPPAGRPRSSRRA
ncbi:saccharopine dehydrogenase NADP-binding domain-containing protein [Actinomadura madurae]|uniref:saccharopine dehydrogenase NADP-binding domain-containing protein n=1 Tax=Actinomadura madurae TaxID=1993 RepID=UPI0020D21512|nr:saccharopine dehydrogenase NADP-binding domain-containing protein [Actinomadura madurae]MCP9984885.1 saccharopine dehydrogenase NADP-binding domain-containing protein [Actinomadura madurae]MCQ0021072.1 saccharopine dehydrogenase NADP-binding domain-containing protein [Actinomadura madurae]